MRYDNDLLFLDHLVKGRKARLFLTGQTDSKYQHHRKDSPQMNHIERKVPDMLRTAAGKQQAIFKISSYGKDKSKVLAHLRYVSRNGTLELEDQEGSQCKGLEEQRELVNDWTLDFDTNKRSRDTLHLVLSTPQRTDRMKALEAVRKFLASEFGDSGHEYLFVLHHDTEHPHVHAVIKMVSRYGKKLNPRKAYLREVRERFAKKCREHGIDVEASSRYERGLSGRFKRSELVQMRKHGRKPYVDQKLIQKIKAERVAGQATSHPSKIKMLKRNQIIRKRYAKCAQVLRQKGQSSLHASQHAQYQRAADVLDHYAKTMPLEETRGEKLHRQLDQRRGVSPHRSSLCSEKIDCLNQYHAVTKGKQNEEGIYISPAELVAHRLSITIKDILKESQSKDRDIDRDD